MPNLRTRFSTAANLSGLKDIEIARQAKVSRAAISMIRDGTTKSLKADNALRIAAVLKVNTQWLVDGTGPVSGKGKARRDDPAWARGMTPHQITLTAYVMDHAHYLADEEAHAILILMEAWVGKALRAKKPKLAL